MNLKKITFGLFLLLIFSFVFAQPALISVKGFRILFTDVIFLFTFFFWILSLLLGKNDFRRGNFYIPLTLYLGAMFLSAVFSEDPQRSFIKLSGVFYLLGLAILAFNLVKTPETAKKIFFVWLAATFISCLISVVTLALFYIDRSNPLLLYTLSHYGTLPPGNYPRIHSTFLNANMFCNYLNVSIMPALAALRLGWIEKNVFFVFILIFSIGAFFTLSPGLGGIGLSVGLWFWLVFREKKQLMLSRLSLIFGILTAILFFLFVLATPNDNPLSPYKIKIPVFTNFFVYPSERLLTWQSALENFRENPVFGRGLGMDAVDETNVIASGQIHTITDAHQLWLNLAVETGIIGLAAAFFLTIFFLRAVKPLHFCKNLNSVWRISLALAFVGAFIYQGLSGSFEDARHLWMLIGLAGSFMESEN